MTYTYYKNFKIFSSVFLSMYVKEFFSSLLYVYFENSNFLGFQNVSYAYAFKTSFTLKNIKKISMNYEL